MMLLVILVVVFTILIFALFFVYLFRVYKRLQIRHAKPALAPNALPQGLEQHQDLAFVFTHGVEAYNELRRQRLQLQQQQDPQPAPREPRHRHPDDNSSIHSNTSTPSVEPLPAYSADPEAGDVGYGWRAGDTGLFAAPRLTGTSITPGTGTATGVAPTASHPLELPALPPMYFYQAPNARSGVQSALVSSDNSPALPSPSRGARRGSAAVVVTRSSPPIRPSIVTRAASSSSTATSGSIPPYTLVSTPAHSTSQSSPTMTTATTPTLDAVTP